MVLFGEAGQGSCLFVVVEEFSVTWTSLELELFLCLSAYVLEFILSLYCSLIIKFRMCDVSNVVFNIDSVCINCMLFGFSINLSISLKN